MFGIGPNIKVNMVEMKIFYCFALLAVPCWAQNMLVDPFKLTDEIWNTYVMANITPYVMPSPPPYYLNVTYPNNLTIHFGTWVNRSQILEKPSLTWNKTDRLYLLYVTGLQFIPRYESFPNDIYHPSTYFFRKKTEYPQWIVGNIPGDRIDLGETIWEYQEPKAPRAESHLLMYVFFVFYQKAKMKFHKLVKDQQYEAIYNFAKWFQLGWPEFGNFLHIRYEENEW